MTETELLQKLAEMEKRLRFLENAHQQGEAAAVMEGQNLMLREARFLAIYDISQELAEHARISEARLLEHFWALVRFHHALLLQKAEDTNPNWAAQIDGRSPDDDLSPDRPPPLFDQPQKE